MRIRIKTSKFRENSLDPATKSILFRSPSVDLSKIGRLINQFDIAPASLLSRKGNNTVDTDRLLAYFFKTSLLAPSFPLFRRYFFLFFIFFLLHYFFFIIIIIIFASATFLYSKPRHLDVSHNSKSFSRHFIATITTSRDRKQTEEELYNHVNHVRISPSLPTLPLERKVNSDRINISIDNQRYRRSGEKFHWEERERKLFIVIFPSIRNSYERTRFHFEPSTRSRLTAKHKLHKGIVERQARRGKSNFVISDTFEGSQAMHPTSSRYLSKNLPGRGSCFLLLPAVTT